MCHKAHAILNKILIQNKWLSTLKDGIMKSLNEERFDNLKKINLIEFLLIKYSSNAYRTPMGYNIIRKLNLNFKAIFKENEIKIFN